MNADQRSNDYNELSKVVFVHHMLIIHITRNMVSEIIGEEGVHLLVKHWARVAGGCYCKKWFLEQLGVSITAYVSQIGTVAVAKGLSGTQFIFN